MEIKDHILMDVDAVPLDLCQEVIDEFERLVKLNEEMMNQQFGQTMEDPTRNTRPHGSRTKGWDDTQIFMHVDSNVSQDILRELYGHMNSSYMKYLEKYPILKDMGRHPAHAIKVHRVSPHGGYHAWHSEVMSNEVSNRVLGLLTYLNDIPDGEGETEFLYQGLRIQPKAGMTTIFPPYFTHTHRGNPVYSTTKYYLTSWFCFVE